VEDTIEQIFEYRLRGLCCSQILIQMGLDEMAEENPRLIDAVKGLCGGLATGGLCGALSGGACLLAMLEPNTALGEKVPALVKWFQEMFQASDCRDIVGDDPMNRINRCPDIVGRVYEKVLELRQESE